MKWADSDHDRAGGTRMRHLKGAWDRTQAILCVGLGVFLLQQSTMALGAEILSFSPEGTVKDVRQARASFSEPMIAFGDPRGNGDPFDISCPGAGHGRWADAKNWV